MNGIFTESESRHLSADECLHYVELGLCPSVGRELLQDLLANEKDKHADLQDQLDEANESAGALQAELDELRESIGRLQLEAKDLLPRVLLDKVLEL